MSDNVHVFIEKTQKDVRRIVAFSVGEKDDTERYATYNSVEKTPDLTHVELPLDLVQEKCRYNLSNLNLDMVDELLESKVPAAQ